MHSWDRCLAMAAVAISLGFSLACNQVAGEATGEAEASASVSQAAPPADSDLTQVGPGDETAPARDMEKRGGLKDDAVISVCGRTSPGASPVTV